MRSPPKLRRVPVLADSEVYPPALREPPPPAVGDGLPIAIEAVRFVAPSPPPGVRLAVEFFRGVRSVFRVAHFWSTIK